MATTLTLATGGNALAADYEKHTQAFDQSLSDIITYDARNNYFTNTNKGIGIGQDIADGLADGTGLDSTLEKLESSKAMLIDNPLEGAKNSRILMVTAEADINDVAKAFNAYFGESVKAQFEFYPVTEQQKQQITPYMEAQGFDTPVYFKDGSRSIIEVRTALLGDTAMNNTLKYVDGSMKKYKSDIHDKAALTGKYVNNELASTTPTEKRREIFAKFTALHEMIHAFGGGSGFHVEKLAKQTELKTATMDFEYSEIARAKPDRDRVHQIMSLVNKRSDHKTAASINGEVISDVGAIVTMIDSLKDNEWESLKADIIEFRSDTNIAVVEYFTKSNDSMEARSSLSHETLFAVLPTFEMLDEHRKNPHPAIEEISNDLTKATVFAFVLNNEIQARHGESVYEMMMDNRTLKMVTDDLAELKDTATEVLTDDKKFEQVLERVSDVLPDAFEDLSSVSLDRDGEAPAFVFDDIESTEPAFVFDDIEHASHLTVENELAHQAPEHKDEPVFVFKDEDKLAALSEQLLAQKNEAPYSQPAKIELNTKLTV